MNEQNTTINKPLISIICVTRNAINDLENCLTSIFEQSYPNIEIIIIDGNSTDGTQKILKKWNHKIAFWVSEPDNGIYDAMNKALKHISGNWVYFIGSDDILLPEFSDFVKHCHDNNTIYYGNVSFKNKICKGFVNPYLQAKHGLFHQSIVYPANIFKQYSFNISYKISADHALNIQLYGAKYKFVYLKYTIAKFNDTGVSANGPDNTFLREKPKLVYQYFGLWIYLRLLLHNYKSK